MTHIQWSSVLFLIIISSNVNSAVTGPKHAKVVVCYIGIWSAYRPDRGAFTIENVDPSLCTHLIYSFAGLDAKEDSIKPLDPWQDLTEDYGKGGYQRITMLKDRFPHLKVTIAIGGWNEGSKNYSMLASDPARRRRFVTNAIQFIKKYNFDGLDLDWEFPGKRGGSEHDKQNFLLLVKELKAAFSKHNLLLTAAFGAGKDTIDIAYDVEGLSVYLDYIHLMCYDYHGAWDKKTGPNAPLRSKDVYNVEYTVEYMLKKGAPAKKLVMGIPFYGRTFLLSGSSSPSQRRPKLGVAAEIGLQGEFTRESGFMGYNEICLDLKNSSMGYKQYWDDESSTPYAVSGNQVIAYDNDRSITEKVTFAIEKGLAGAMVWSIDTDDFQGDCSEASESEPFINFPLLRQINKAIEIALEDIQNNIIHGKEQQTSTASTLYKITLLYSSLIVIFNFFN